MESILEVIQVAVLAFLEVLGYAMLLRAILSLFASEDSKLLEICYAITEPVVAPVRSLMNRIPGFLEIGIDFSFMATYLILIIIRTILLSVL